MEFHNMHFVFCSLYILHSQTMQYVFCIALSVCLVELFYIHNFHHQIVQGIYKCDKIWTITSLYTWYAEQHHGVPANQIYIDTSPCNASNHTFFYNIVLPIIKWKVVLKKVWVLDNVFLNSELSMISLTLQSIHFVLTMTILYNYCMLYINSSDWQKANDLKVGHMLRLSMLVNRSWKWRQSSFCEHCAWFP